MRQKNMVSKAELQSRFVKKALLNKAVWLPVVLGTATMALASGTPFWLGAAAIGLGIGAAVWRFTGGRRTIEEQVIQRLRYESNRQHYAYLRALQRKLRRDRDPRTGRMLRQLRQTHKRMVEAKVFASNQNDAWNSDIRDRLSRLYESSVGSLERSFDLWNSAEKVHDPEVKNELVESRSQLLNEVTESIGWLGKTLDQMQVSKIQSEQPAAEPSGAR